MSENRHRETKTVSRARKTNPKSKCPTDLRLFKTTESNTASALDKRNSANSIMGKPISKPIRICLKNCLFFPVAAYFTALGGSKKCLKQEGITCFKQSVRPRADNAGKGSAPVSENMAHNVVSSKTGKFIRRRESFANIP